jgi:flagellar basal-body rod modification protein FlgD
MDINSVTSNYVGATGETSALGQMDMQKADFMKLLIAQMQNQDPLQPMENSDFSAQLAQFSSLEQLQNINASVQEGVEVNLVLTQAINNSLSATVIGKVARGYGDSLSISDGEVQSKVNFKLNGTADDVEINIKDSTGTIVRTLTGKGLEAGDHAMEWDGKDNDGKSLSDGNYTFEVKATDPEGNAVGAKTYVEGFVESVRYDSGMAKLLINGKEIAFSAILELRENRG